MFIHTKGFNILKEDKKKKKNVQACKMFGADP